MGVLESRDVTPTLAAAQSLLAKHEAFETDMSVHRDRVNDIEKVGRNLIEQVDFLNFLND